MFINGNADSIATITTAGGEWKATQDCYCKVSMGSATTSSAAKVYLDEFEILGTVLATNTSVTYPYSSGFYVKKGQVVKTNSGSHKFALIFKPLF